LIQVEKPEYFRANLYRLMTEKGWSIKRLAAEAKVSYHTAFRAISKGIIPRGENQQKLAEALGVTIADLHVEPRRRSPPKHQGFGHSRRNIPSVYEQLIHAKSLITVPSASVHLLDLFLGAPPRVRALVLALLANDESIAEPYYRDVETLRKQLINSD